VTDLVINEIDYDQVGTDGAGFVEIKNIGDGAVTLDGIALVLVNGGDGQEYDRVALTGSLAAGAYLVLDVDAQNGAPDGAAVVDTRNGALLDALSYEGAINAAVIDGRTYDLVEGTMLPVDVADSNTLDGSLSRIPDGEDHDDAAADWEFTTTKTRGAANVATS
jgi:large repetitive protein